MLSAHRMFSFAAQARPTPWHRSLNHWHPLTMTTIMMMIMMMLCSPPKIHTVWSSLSVLAADLRPEISLPVTGHRFQYWDKPIISKDRLCAAVQGVQLKLHDRQLCVCASAQGSTSGTFEFLQCTVTYSAKPQQLA
eukprot:scpid52799/ scgid14486/ 